VGAVQIGRDGIHSQIDGLKEVIMTDVNDRFLRFSLSLLIPSASKKLER
jgi:hypothetical protein